MSEVTQEVDGIDDIVARAKERMSRGPVGTLPKMSPSEILGPSSSDSKVFNTYDELDAAQSRRDLPSPEENVKTLGDLMAKYRIGDDPDFKALLYRTWPRMFANGAMAEGYYATYDQPITEQSIAGEFGGGHYRVVIQGPRPNVSHGTKHYASSVVKIAGEPRTDRVPNRGVGALPATNNVVPLRSDSEGMVDKAFSTLHEVFRDERAERHALEARQHESGRNVQEVANSMNAVYERFTQQMLDSERAAHERERKLIEDRARDREERMAEQERRYERDRQSTPDPFDQLSKAASLFKGDGGEGQQRMIDSILAKHRDEIAAFREESARVTDRIREANAQEAAAIREASRREVEAERSASQTRERELLRQVEHDREERRRDQERYREDLANRDQIAKDRLESQLANQNTSWQARYDMLASQHELRLAYLKDDNDRKTHELEELRGSVRDAKDPITQMRQMQEFRETAKDILGVRDDSSSSRGIGSEAVATPPGFDMSKLFESLAEKGPAYLEAFSKLMQPPAQQQQQPTPQPGQILNLPDGQFQVVMTPQGMGMVPYQPPQRAPVPTRLPSQQQQRPRALPRQPQPMPDLDDMFSDEQPAEATAKLKQRATPPRPQTPRRPAAKAPPAAAVAAPAVAELPKLPEGVQKQISQMVGELLNAAIMKGDEPEDFLAGITEKYPAELLQGIAQLDIEAILPALREEMPTSAVFTPGGMIFTRTVFAQLRAMHNP